MKRLLQVVVLSWALIYGQSWALSDALKAILFTPAPAAGGSAVTFDVAIDASADVGVTLNSADFTISGTSNRFALAGMMTREFAVPATHSSMSVEGAGMTQQGTTATVDAARVSRWSLIAPASGSTRTLSGTISDADDVFIIAGVVYNGVNQTTPINSTATPTSATLASQTSISPSITVTTVSGGKAVVVLSVKKGATDIPTLDCSGSSSAIRTQEYLTFELLAIVEKDNTGGSTTVSCTVSFLIADVDWRMDGYGIQPP